MRLQSLKKIFKVLCEYHPNKVYVNINFFPIFPDVSMKNSTSGNTEQNVKTLQQSI